ncbi:MAG: AMP-binding protein [Chloroflexota bacterium]|nr:AMP-binding protein [Chloroflexota bacterium]
MNADTLPGLLLSGYQKYGDRKVALRKKDFGIWKSYTWQDYYEHVKVFCLGMVSLGLKPGNTVFIIGENDPYWVFAQLACNSAGGCSAGFYQDSGSSELKYIIDHCDAKFAVVEDQEQADKILEVLGDLPKLEKIIFWDPKGLKNYDDPILISFREVETMGREYEKDNQGIFEKMVEGVSEDNLAMISYTSGTTGQPKGAMITHQSLVSAAQALQTLTPIYDNDNLFSSAPLCWAAEQSLSVVRNLTEGAMVNFYEEPESVQTDIREIGPGIMISPPRIWDNFISMIQVRIADATSVKRLVYRLFLPVGYRIADFKFQNQRPNAFWKTVGALGRLILFRPLKDQLGLLKSKRAITAGAPLGQDAFRFFHALGVNLVQVFGMTEAGGCITVHPDDQVKFETVGQPYVGYETRIAGNSEILFRSSSLFEGYHKDPEATAKTLHEGWLYSGDAGLIDEDGHLVHFDRMSDLMVLTEGSRFSPAYIETRLKFSPYIKEALVVGNNQNHAATLINIDFQNVGKWAETNRIAYTTFTDLSQKPQVYDLVQKDIEKVNRILPEMTRIKIFANLYKELDPDEAEMTRTRKLRRGFLEERYEGLIVALYEGSKEVKIESEFKYRDGRVGKMETTVNIVHLYDSLGG